jgi:hypothetical protein
MRNEHCGPAGDRLIHDSTGKHSFRRAAPRRGTLSAARTVASSWVLLAAASGCNSDRTEEPVLLGVSEQALYGDPSVYWTGSPPMVPVCWEPKTFDVSSQSSERTWIEDAARRNWNRFARINLVGSGGASTWQRCTTNAPGVHAFFSPGVCGGFSGIGRPLNGVTDGTRLTDCEAPCQPAAGVTQEQCVRRVGMHEFGHVVGFFHEEERPNEGLPDCNGTPQTIPGGQKYGAYNDASFMAECTSTLTAVDQTPGDIAGIQRAYGRRITGSMVSPFGRCAASVAGAVGDPVFIFDCDEFADDQEIEFLHATGQLRVRSTNLCFRANSSNALSMQTCDTSAVQQRWALNSVFIRGWGGLCLDVRGGITVGGIAQLFECGALGGSNQRWRIVSAGTAIEIRFGTTNSCLTSGTPYRIQPCTGASNQRFSWLGNGQIRSTADNQCADVSGVSDAQYLAGAGMPTSGAAVNPFACQSQTGVNSGGTMTLNQLWNISGPITHSSGTCLRRTGTGNGSNVNTGACTGSDLNETWDYYPRFAVP